MKFTSSPTKPKLDAKNVLFNFCVFYASLCCVLVRIIIFHLVPVCVVQWIPSFFPISMSVSLSRPRSMAKNYLALFEPIFGIHFQHQKEWVCCFAFFFLGHTFVWDCEIETEVLKAKKKYLKAKKLYVKFKNSTRCFA